MTTWEERVIAQAVLLGFEPHYDDFGHPERAHCRQYWTAQSRRHRGVKAFTVYGHTRSDCAIKWLRQEGYTVRRSDGSLIKRDAHS